MAAMKAVAILIGLCVLCVLVNRGEGVAVTITGLAITVAENTAAIGTLTFGGAPTGASILSEPNPGQFAVAFATGAITLNGGFTLDYEIATSITIVVQAVNGDPSTASATVTITVTDVVEEFDSEIMSVCLVGTSFSAGTEVFTKAARTTGSTVTAVYSLEAQTPDSGYLALGSASTGMIKVATGRTLDGTIIPVLTANVKLISSAPAVTTSTAVVTIIMGCSTSAASVMLGGVPLILTMLVALLQLYTR